MPNLLPNQYLANDRKVFWRFVINSDAEFVVIRIQNVRVLPTSLLLPGSGEPDQSVSGVQFLPRFFESLACLAERCRSRANRERRLYSADGRLRT